MNRKTNRKKYLFFLTTMIILIIAFVAVIGAMIFRQWFQGQKEKLVEDIRPEVTGGDLSVTDTEGTSGDGIAVPDLDFDWDAILAQNQDIYAWLYVPNTSINYPVLQHPSDDTFYLLHNLDGSYGRPGCVYTESANSKDFSDLLTIMYGHNMKNGTMFHTLTNYKEEAFFNENPYIYVYLPDGQALVYEIFSAREYETTHLLTSYGADDPAGFQRYLEDFITHPELSLHIRDGVEVTENSHVLVLSTCKTGNSKKRFLVQGVLIQN